jgi:hypothetical protein
VAIQPDPPNLQPATRARDTAELRLRPARRGLRRLIAIVLAVIGLCAIAVAAVGIHGQLKPRTFTLAQQKRIQAWDVARRWRTTPKSQIFPPVISYTLPSAVASKGNGLKLSARRLEIARQASCARAVGGSKRFMSFLAADGCKALLRSAYTDSTSSLVVTAGIAVLKDQPSAVAATEFLTRGAAEGQGGVARRLVLKPLRVSGTPAALYGYPQRQLSWAVAAGPYLVMTTVGYADGRPRVTVLSDAYIYQEMARLASGVAVRIAAPLGHTPPIPRCPGVPSC